MDYYFILFLIVAAYLSINGEENPKRKKLFISIYTVLIGLALLYNFGLSIGYMVHYIINP